MSNTHEDFERQHTPQGSSDRSFGLVFTGFFLVVTFWPLLHHRQERWWALGVSAAFLLITAVAPGLLHPLNLVWTRLGLLLSRITNPIVSGLLFYVVFTPVGLLFRLLGKDLLRLKYDRSAATYWIVRDPAGPAPESMRNQF